MANWIKSQNPSFGYPGNASHMQEYTKAKNKGMEEDLPSKWRAKKAGVAILVSDKMDFKPKSIFRDKEGHYIMVKRYATRKANYPKYICTQYRSTQIHKANS